MESCNILSIQYQPCPRGFISLPRLCCHHCCFPRHLYFTPNPSHSAWISDKQEKNPYLHFRKKEISPGYLENHTVSIQYLKGIWRSRRSPRIRGSRKPDVCQAKVAEVLHLVNGERDYSHLHLCLTRKTEKRKRNVNNTLSLCSTRPAQCLSQKGTREVLALYQALQRGKLQPERKKCLLLPIQVFHQLTPLIKVTDWNFSVISFIYAQSRWTYISLCF